MGRWIANIEKTMGWGLSSPLACLMRLPNLFSGNSVAYSPSAATAPYRRLLALARDLLQAHDLKSVLEPIGSTFLDLLNPDEALLLVSLGEQEYVTAFDRRGLLQPADQESILYLRSGQALSARTPLTESDLDTSSEVLPSGRSAPGKASILAFPFPSVQPIGVLTARWNRQISEGKFAEHVSILRYLGDLAGASFGYVSFTLALEENVSVRTEEAKVANREHNRELQHRDDIEREKDRIAVTDVLTGMLNRRGFFLQAEQGFKMARRQGMASTVIFADIDDLKTVNDELGHDAGDHLIQAGARILQESFRDSDIVARLGGDEFAAFTLDSGKPENILARIQENIDQFHRRSSIPYRVSFSIGIVQCDPSSELDLSGYLALADKQMYAEKRGRRG